MRQAGRLWRGGVLGVGRQFLRVLYVEAAGGYHVRGQGPREKRQFAVPGSIRRAIGEDIHLPPERAADSSSRKRGTHLVRDSALSLPNVYHHGSALLLPPQALQHAAQILAARRTVRHDAVRDRTNLRYYNLSLKLLSLSATFFALIFCLWYYCFLSLCCLSLP